MTRNMLALEHKISWTEIDSNKVSEVRIDFVVFRQGTAENLYVYLYELNTNFKPYTPFNWETMELF